MIEGILQYGFFTALAIFSAGALGTLIIGSASDKASSVFSHGMAALAAGIGLIFSVSALLTGSTIIIRVGQALGMAQNVLTFRIDPLAALFIAAISTVALAASIYGIGYQKQYLGVYRLRSFGFFYNTFLMSMLLVVAADNGLLFLFAWELMAIASYFLVVFERKIEKNIRAGTLYILISQLGALFLFGAFLLLHAQTGSWDFDSFRAFASQIPLSLQSVILAFALFGFAAKAGVIPLHIWLPEAHPAAPSHVSALMSGVMIKTAIFMIIRFFVDFFPNAPEFWGLLILTLGAVSSLLGVLYALTEHDIKRLLAFHSVENIGIILLGVGGAITFFSLGMPALAILSLTAGLYHTLNHALFKALLFLSAGSVVHATRTRNMEDHGGIIRLMPWTAFFFLIGAVAISGLPPFNGFVSEWLTFQSLFAGILQLPLAGKLVFLLGASSLAFTGALAAACFVKAFGVIFLARPRSEHAKSAHESDLGMQAGMALLSVLIVAFGIGASSIAPIIAHAAEALRGSIGAVPLEGPARTLTIDGFSSLAMVGVAAALGAGILITYIFVWLTSRSRKVTISRTWDCGFELTPRAEITATGFSRSIIIIFKGLLRPSVQSDVEYHDGTTRYFPKSRAVHLSLPDLYRTYIYGPAALLIVRSAQSTRRIQTGNLNTYLLYMFLTVLLVLWWALK